jgi:hypothetical protein
VAGHVGVSATRRGAVPDHAPRTGIVKGPLRQGGQPPYPPCPRLQSTGGDGRFGQVVEDEGEPGQPPGGLHRGRELVGFHQQVVDEARVGDGGQAAQHVGACQPAGVRFALHLVADAHQALTARPFAQPVEGVGDLGRGEVGPADDPGDQVAPGGQSEELGGLLGHGDRLYQHGGGDSGGTRFRFQVREREVATQRGEFGTGDPVLVADGEVPDMVVGVDDPDAPARAPAVNTRDRGADTRGRAGVRPAHSSHTTGSDASEPSAE